MRDFVYDRNDSSVFQLQTIEVETDGARKEKVCYAMHICSHIRYTLHTPQSTHTRKSDRRRPKRIWFECFFATFIAPNIFRRKPNSLGSKWLSFQRRSSSSRSRSSKHWFLHRVRMHPNSSYISQKPTKFLCVRNSAAPATATTHPDARRIYVSMFSWSGKCVIKQAQKCQPTRKKKKTEE